MQAANWTWQTMVCLSLCNDVWCFPLHMALVLLSLALHDQWDLQSSKELVHNKQVVQAFNSSTCRSLSVAVRCPQIEQLYNLSEGQYESPFGF